MAEAKETDPLLEATEGAANRKLYYDTNPPDVVSAELQPIIDELGLNEACEHLAKEGHIPSQCPQSAEQHRAGKDANQAKAVVAQRHSTEPIGQVQQAERESRREPREQHQAQPLTAHSRFNRLQPRPAASALAAG